MKVEAEYETINLLGQETFALVPGDDSVNAQQAGIGDEYELAVKILYRKKEQL